MPLKRITMQEIADACGLSRNTVSKVFNDRGSVPESTRNLVLTKAQEIGFFLRTAEGGYGREPGGNVAILTQHKLLSHNFGAYFITSFTDQICRAGYTMQIYEVSANELLQKKLPPHFDPEHTSGILSIELFDREYFDLILSLGIPTVYVDGYAGVRESAIRCDFVSMENYSSEAAMVKRMIAGGARRLGFVGDIDHCNSFYERWVGFCRALSDAGLSADRNLCILKEDGDLYKDTEWLISQLSAMPAMPDAFACANDFLAIHLMTALKQMGFSIPKDVMIAGFDGSPEASVVEPSLTTARIPSTDIGRLAAFLLTERIRLPEFPFHWTDVKTVPIFGRSTGGNGV